MSTYEISKSSILSLKAEILRKQQELAKAKVDNEIKLKIIKKNSPLELKNKGVEAREKFDTVEEDANLLKQSRSALEYKAQLYDKLSSGKITEDEKRIYLVKFDKKRKSKTSVLPPSDTEDNEDTYPESDKDCYISDDEATKDPGDKWVDYVDCLGRTRKCLQKDLEYLKAKDDEFRKTMDKKQEQEPNKVDKTEIPADPQEQNNEKVPPVVTEESELLSNDMRRDMLRQQWEQEEEKLKSKSNIYYQDILFGEARTHGVGYYGFSTDEEERLKQQQALRNLREETEQNQKKAQERKALREKQLAARVKAAKNRRRARLGLPPEEDEPTPVQEIDEEEKKKQEEQKLKDEAKEKLLEEARKQHLRPWDIGKEGVKVHYEMSQEEWVDKKRKDRPQEFAPPASYRKDFRSTVESDDLLEDNNKSLKFTTKKNKLNITSSRNLNPYKTHGEQTNSNPICSSNKYDRQFNHDRDNETDSETFVQNRPIIPTPIVNLLDNTDSGNNLLSNPNDSDSSSSSEADEELRNKGVEIAPPPTYEYYGPSLSKTPKISSGSSDITDSIEAGLKFLRQQVEKKEKSSNHCREMYLS